MTHRRICVSNIVRIIKDGRESVAKGNRVLRKPATMDVEVVRVAAHDLAHFFPKELVSAYGIEVEPEGAWGPREARTLPLSDGTTARLTHDEREAPFVMDAPELLVSLSDEKGVAVCVWARPREGSALVGLGVDLASVEDFAGERGDTFNHLLFSKHEQRLVASRYEEAGRTEYGYAMAFSAKEAAFKACAAPLRTWYAAHDDLLEFEMREFELEDLSHARGTLRRAKAQWAMDHMGIRTVVLKHAELPEAVMTVAFALT